MSFTQRLRGLAVFILFFSVIGFGLHFLGGLLAPILVSSPFNLKGLQNEAPSIIGFYFVAFLVVLYCMFFLISDLGEDLVKRFKKITSKSTRTTSTD